MAEPSQDIESKAPRPIPWDEPQGRALSAFVQTLKECLFSPWDFFSRVPLREDRWAALGFALLVHVLGFSAAMLWLSLRDGALDKLALMRVVIAPLWVLASVWLGSEVMHGFLKLFRGARYSRTITHRAVAYCYSTAVLGLIPFHGLKIGLLAAVVWQIIGISRAQEAPLWKGAAAVLLTWTLLFGFLLLAALSGQPLTQE